MLANQRLAAQAAARRTSASREEAERARVADDDAQVDAKREWAGKLAQRASFERAAVQTAREAAEVHICIWPAYAMHLQGGTHRSGCLRAGERETLATPPPPPHPACMLTVNLTIAVVETSCCRRRRYRHHRRPPPTFTSSSPPA